ncbi:MAG: ribonuclease HI [Armatimonadetes bacterium]|nr:ribonuclease HI [Anaerolineae bacterium]
MTPLPTVTIYTDGGAQPNPGTGGYGVLLLFPDRRVELSDGERDTTNNRMELTAACAALESLETRHAVTLYTDSEYVKNGITKWIAGWIRKNWRDVKNPDLWQRLHEASQQHDISWKWVRGHAGNANNERVDQLATAAREQLQGKRSTPILEASAATPVAAAKFDYVAHTATDYDAKTKTGGWAVVLQHGEALTELSGGVRSTSEYHLALLAAVAALEALAGSGSAQVHTESETVQKGATLWVKGWRKNGWRNSKGEPVVHQALWQQLDGLQQPRTVRWVQSSGGSQRADALATAARKAQA